MQAVGLRSRPRSAAVLFALALVPQLQQKTATPWAAVPIAGAAARALGEETGEEGGLANTFTVMTPAGTTEKLELPQGSGGEKYPILPFPGETSYCCFAVCQIYF